jgi:NAD(P)-dependent dehydrogenase (short-subunit alcohol dehydrogenase family)
MMSGKLVMVTGATAGIGAATARELARRGAHVVAVGRSPERIDALCEVIRKETLGAQIEGLCADLSSRADIHAMCDVFRERHGRLDVLVNNAGGLFLKRKESVDGVEMTFALNHLGYFLLTRLLLDTLIAAAPSRIVNVSSTAHTRASLDFDDLEGRRNYRGFKAYADSKFANLLFTYELARRLEGTGVTVNALHPGVVATQFASANGWKGAAIQMLMRLFAISPEAGARTVVYLATSPDVEGVTGKYFDKERAVESTPASHDRAAAARLWDVSEQMTGLASRPALNP